MTYSSAVEYLYGLQRHGIKLGLENIRALLARLGHPQQRYRSLHIAGTNGKGSTSAMAASILQAARHRVGLYTSPHLIDFRERVRVDGQMITESRVAELVDRLRSVMPSDAPLTFFEFTTALALEYFAQCEVEVAVLEVGMGGRCDATNVVDPVATAITTISFDHEEYLGRSIEQIAGEKAGIIKPNVPLIVGRMGPEAAHTIESFIHQRGVPAYCLDRHFSMCEQPGGLVEYHGIHRHYRGLTVPLLGKHQLDNAACAVALVEAVSASGTALPEDVVRSGLASTRWEGRLEIVDRHPTIIVDGAHNPAAASVLAQFLREYRGTHPGSRIAMILGMMKDKAHRLFLRPLLPYCDQLIVTQADMARALPASELGAAFHDLMPSIRIAAAPADAVLLARGLVTSADVICITGSLMLVGEIKAFLRGCTLSPVRG